MDIFLPSPMVTSGVGLPAVCARHGEGAAYSRQTKFVSPAREWSVLLLLVGVLPFILVAASLRKTLTATGWPSCARCHAERTARRQYGLTLVRGWNRSLDRRRRIRPAFRYLVCAVHPWTGDVRGRPSATLAPAGPAGPAAALATAELGLPTRSHPLVTGSQPG